jgi:hypothetical protein
MVTQLGPEDLRVSKHHSTCLTAGITVTHPFKERNLRKLEMAARQAASAEPTQHAPISPREQAPQVSPDSPESEANFSIIRNTFDRQLRGAGGGDEPGDSG